MVRRVAVIGAGISGLAATKCCLEEGLEPICFESSEDIGGLWRIADSTDCRRVSVYHSIISNTSKEMSCFSDFPFPEDFPSFLTHSLFLEYLRMYAQHFQLLKHIRFKTTVISVRKRPDFAISGQWDVVTETEGIQESHVFDAVMVCTGNFQTPHLPLASFPGIETCFRGQYFHSLEYKDVAAFRGKRVLVVGLGNTACDIAVDMSHVAAKVFLSARSSTWIFSRLANHGFPWDMVTNTRFKHLLEWLLPSAVMRKIKIWKLNSWFNHEIYSLASARSSNFNFIINEELPFCLLSGTIVLKSNVKEFTETSAIFEDGTTEENIDVVIFATGYNFSFPFLEESVRNSLKSNSTLYKCVFPPQLERPTLAVIGLIKLTGSVMVGAEIQARWAAGVFAGACKLPPSSKMMAEVSKNQLPVKRNPSAKQVLRFNFISYTSEIASYAGVKPNMLWLLLTDPRLALAVFFGPCTSYQYRLTGRGQWSGARAAILTQWQRVLKPLRTRVLEDGASSHSWCWLGLLALPTVLVVGFLLSKRPRLGWAPQGLLF
ncbi:dimethylaniline monooxygenase [N-oxide-forming] 2-like isoform X2 [Coturnix japonica]|nr:dimethylaniline monooxygenase [N-oxide-forming] 2-like isoform X2 [Coturnix japonica]XP_015725216.1 dimethylaniline monooxygenase [N-oxide-forming] 2-like isoform X2 [Coturnix japonica]